MAVLERGLTIKDDSQPPASQCMPESSGPVPDVSPPHEHVTDKHPATRKHDMSNIHDVDGLGPSLKMMEGGGGVGVTAHPPASAGVVLEEGELDAADPGGAGGAVGQMTLRQHLAAAAQVGPERVRQIEQALAAAVKRGATVYVTKEQVLQKVLREVDGDVGELGVRDVRRVCSSLTVLRCCLTWLYSAIRMVGVANDVVHACMLSFITISTSSQ